MTLLQHFTGKRTKLGLPSTLDRTNVRPTPTMHQYGFKTIYIWVDDSYHRTLKSLHMAPTPETVTEATEPQSTVRYWVAYSKLRHRPNVGLHQRLWHSTRCISTQWWQTDSEWRRETLKSKQWWQHYSVKHSVNQWWSRDFFLETEPRPRQGGPETEPRQGGPETEPRHLQNVSRPSRDI